MINKKRLIISGILIGSMICLAGCGDKDKKAEEQTPPETVTETAEGTDITGLNLYKDKQGGFVVNMLDGWEVTATNDTYLTLTPKTDNPVQNACIVVSFQTDYTLDNTYEMFLNTMNIKDIIRYRYNTTEYDTLGYYYEVPVEENIGGIPVMVEVPKLSLVGVKNNNDKLVPKTKFFHYGGNEPNRNFMIGYISDEASEAYVESIVREMIPNTKENRTLDFNRNNIEETAFRSETIKTGLARMSISIPESWQTLDLGKNGMLFRSSMQQGSSFEDCYLLVLADKATGSNVDILNSIESNRYKIANASMRMPLNDNANINLNSIPRYANSQTGNYLGLNTTIIDTTFDISRGGTEMEIEEIPPKTEKTIIYQFVKNDVRYLMVFGHMNLDNEQYVNNIRALNTKILNSIVF